MYGYAEQPYNIISTCIHQLFMSFEIQLKTKTLFFWHVDPWCVQCLWDLGDALLWAEKSM